MLNNWNEEIVAGLIENYKDTVGMLDNASKSFLSTCINFYENHGSEIKVKTNNAVELENILNGLEFLKDLSLHTRNEKKDRLETDWKVVKLKAITNLSHNKKTGVLSFNLDDNFAQIGLISKPIPLDEVRYLS